MKKLVLLIVLGLFLFTSGCGCMGGLGRDIQQSGKWLEDTADSASK